MAPDLPRSPRWIARGVLAVCLLLLLVGAAAATITYEPPEIATGNVTQPANGSTLVAIQGFHWQGEGNPKKPARLLSFNETGGLAWKYDGSRRGATWFYDADPLPNGNVLAVNTIREDGVGKTLVYELDPRSKERVWTEKFNITDTHDVDLINGDQLLVANMREWDKENGTSNDRLFLYDLGEEEIVWEWYFKNHYPASTDGGMKPDWSHVNDVDKIGEGKYMASPRNFDQVIVVDRETKNITLRLGEDDNHDIINEQHNPTYLETADGRPVILVADSENNRVVEYTCTERVDGDCEWELTWEVGNGQLNWPRDANRLPNGNTLITDSRNHRVLEVTPTGRIVWETFAPWGPFSAERVVRGNDGVRSPAMADMGYQGTYRLKGTAGLTPSTGDSLTFPEWLRANVAGLPVVGGPARSLADAWQAGAQWIRPVWMAPWSFVYLVVAAVLGLVWGVSEAVYQRRRIAERARTVTARMGAQ
ncbi:MAG: aryl-sulfate sulfotransferase [Halobacteriales archaeon]